MIKGRGHTLQVGLRRSKKFGVSVFGAAFLMPALVLPQVVVDPAASARRVTATPAPLTILKGYFAHQVAPYTSRQRAPLSTLQGMEDYSFSGMTLTSSHTSVFLSARFVQLLRRNQKPCVIGQLKRVSKESRSRGQKVTRFVRRGNAVGIYTFAPGKPQPVAEGWINPKTATFLKKHDNSPLKNMLLAYFGEALSSETGFTRNGVSVYDGSGTLRAKISAPKGLYFNPVFYSVARTGSNYVVAVAGTEQEKQAYSNEPETDIFILSLRTGSRSGATSLVKVHNKLLPPLLSALPRSSKEWGRVSLGFPSYVPATGSLLFRRLRETENLKIVELWCRKTNGQYLLIDAIAWSQFQNSPPSHFTVDEQGKVVQDVNNSATWGPDYDMVPCVSLDGKEVAYKKRDTIWTARIP